MTVHPLPDGVRPLPEVNPVSREYMDGISQSHATPLPLDLADAANLIARYDPAAVWVIRGNVNAEEVTHAANALAEHTGALVLVMTPGVELESLDEDEMRRRGWCRVQDEPDVIDAEEVL